MTVKYTASEVVGHLPLGIEMPSLDLQPSTVGLAKGVMSTEAMLGLMGTDEFGGDTHLSETQPMSVMTDGCEELEQARGIETLDSTQMIVAEPARNDGDSLARRHGLSDVEDSMPLAFRLVEARVTCSRIDDQLPNKNYTAEKIEEQRQSPKKKDEVPKPKTSLKRKSEVGGVTNADERVASGDKKTKDANRKPDCAGAPQNKCGTSHRGGKIGLNDPKHPQKGEEKCVGSKNSRKDSRADGKAHETGGGKIQTTASDKAKNQKDGERNRKDQTADKDTNSKQSTKGSVSVGKDKQGEKKQTNDPNEGVKTIEKHGEWKSRSNNTERSEQYKGKDEGKNEGKQSTDKKKDVGKEIIGSVAANKDCQKDGAKEERKVDNSSEKTVNKSRSDRIPKKVGHLATIDSTNVRDAGSEHSVITGNVAEEKQADSTKSRIKTKEAAKRKADSGKTSESVVDSAVGIKVTEGSDSRVVIESQREGTKVMKIVDGRDTMGDGEATGRMAKEHEEATVTMVNVGREPRQILEIDMAGNSDAEFAVSEEKEENADVKAKRRKTSAGKPKIFSSTESESGSTSELSWCPPRIPSTIRHAPPSFNDIRKAVFDLVERHGGKHIDPLYVARTLGGHFHCNMEPMMGAMGAMADEAARSIRSSGDRRSVVPPPSTRHTVSDGGGPYEASWPAGQPCRLPPPPRSDEAYRSRDPRITRSDFDYPKQPYEEWRRY